MSDCDIGSWCAWLDELPALMNFQIPRCLKQGHQSASTDNELHIFCDASEQAYGACAYIRVASAGHVTTMLVMGKSRVAPLKPQISVPRLELSAAVVGCQLGCMIERGLELRVSRVVFWSDSMIALAYIKNTKTRFKTFVANRLTQIHETTKPDQWRHVSTNVNPADLASRGFSANDTAKLQFWLHGPTFLLGDEKTWPAVNKEDVSQATLDDEIKKEGAVNLIEAAEEYNVIGALVDRHSSWYRLRRACAWLLRFKTYYVNKYLKKEKELTTSHLSVTELDAASADIVRYV
ncbi:PREDICTED: uncharacterized protein LOC106811541 [Priapulus caudatus]|uniref:Uncharacterized protein LOC106811541 n=1 Tax=Priapulus caudatus TaxID=37621 RepID=A0ABM1EES2_PRICU|nr:PREDICTED: uncharacterized protein LOC106811541 [Priapulus caudatus]